MQTRLRASWPDAPPTSFQSLYAEATPTLAAAGMVVTEMSTPTSAPDLAVERERAPAAPASSATRIVYSSGCEMKSVAGRATGLRRSGAESTARRTPASASAAAITDGEADGESRQRASRECTLALQEGGRRRDPRADRTRGRPPSLR
jgi:hypothetical protein